MSDGLGHCKYCGATYVGGDGKMDCCSYCPPKQEQLDDEKCDMCTKIINHKNVHCIKMKKVDSGRTMFYFLCEECYDLVDEYIQDCRNAV